MVKWANYGISAVRYNSKGTHIDQVQYHADNGDTIGSSNVCSREQVISALERGYTFVTILKDSAGNWTKGSKVEIVTVHGTKYIRTDRNSTASDNLGSLPRF